MKFLKYFPKDSEGLYMLYELYSFDNFFRLLLKYKLEHKEALLYILAKCALSAIVFQERIHNNFYLKLRREDAPSSKIASIKSILV